jgi:hypothetical protein
MARPGHRLPTVTLYAEKKEVKSAFDKATKTWICLTCGEPFSLLMSMGSLECRQHPGYVQEDGRWSCCGQHQFPPRWSNNWPITRMYSSTDHWAPYAPLPSIKGCQKCDHNTSDQPFTHQDAQPIADLSAILPFMNKEFPFALRNGFDNGLLRRCECKPIVIPKKAAVVKYMDIEGHIKFYNTATRERYTLDNDEKRENIEQLDGNPPRGIEMVAYDTNNYELKKWY